MRQNLTDEEKIAAHNELVSALHRCRTGLQLNLMTSPNPTNDQAAINQATRALVLVRAI